MVDTPWPELDEDVRRRFEAAWSRAEPVTIEELLASVREDQRLATLEELVCIELELRWRATAPGPAIDSYLARFPELAAEPIAGRLRAEAAQVADRFGAGMRRGEAVGRGGMGVVWRATDPSLGRDVALKELQPDARQHAELRARFLAEARVTAQLEHPGVVPVYQLVEDAEAPYYTMKLVQGRTLDEAARAARDPVAQRRLYQALLTVVRTVAFAHARGVVHRDLKPENVLLGEYGETVVLDWGLARAEPVAGVAEAVDPALTQAGTVLGTPAFMSPEQVGGQPASPLSDQYALGAVLYQLLTGSPPYSGATAEGVMAAVRAGPPADPRAHGQEVAVELDAICRRAMARDPDRRYPSADALADDLERFLAGEPTVAWPEPWTRRLARLGRRYRTGVGVGLTAVVVGALAGGVGLVAEERAQAREAQRVAALTESVRAAVAEARADLRHGRFPEARDRLVAALGVVGGETGLHGEAPELLDRATALASFAALAEEADRLAFLGFHAEAAQRSERALAELDVFDHADWWFALPAGPGPEQEDALRWSVWHQLNLLSSLLAEDHCEHAAAIARHGAWFRPSAVLDRALTCAPRDPCVSDGSGSYWTELEWARCAGESPTGAREGLGYALRARAELGLEGDPREAFGDLQAALDRDGALAEVHWLIADGLEQIEDPWGNETARAYARALSLERAERRPRSAVAQDRLRARVQRAAAYADRPVGPDVSAWLEPDLAALREQVDAMGGWQVPGPGPVAPPGERPVGGSPARLAVLNGGFELGLARHWGRGQYESQRPVWWNSRTARSTAEVVQDDVHSGERALHIRHETLPGHHLYGTTSQSVPMAIGARYRLTVWARQPTDSPQSTLAFPVDAAWDQYAVGLHQAEDWTEFTGEFVAKADTLHLRILTLGPLEAWLDDIAVERVDGP